MKKFQERLLEQRTEHRMTQCQVATYLHITQPSYIRYENGSAEPSIDTLIRLADLFDFTPLTGRRHHRPPRRSCAKRFVAFPLPVERPSTYIRRAKYFLWYTRYTVYTNSDLYQLLPITLEILLRCGVCPKFECARIFYHLFIYCFIRSCHSGIALINDILCTVNGF